MVPSFPFLSVLPVWHQVRSFRLFSEHLTFLQNMASNPVGTLRFITEKMLRCGLLPTYTLHAHSSIQGVTLWFVADTQYTGELLWEKPNVDCKARASWEK